jgi:hypothetical protein
MAVASLSGHPETPDWPCPAGHPWGYKEVPRLPPGRPPPGDSYADVVARIHAAPAEGLWVLLKDELRILTNVLTYQSHRSPCWKRRQQTRLMSQYHVVAARLQPVGTPIAR